MKQVLVWGLALLFLCGCNSDAEKAKEVSPQKTSAEPVRIIALGRVEPELKITSVGCEVSGVVQKIYFQAGDTVKKDQVIVELKHAYEDARLAQTKSKFGSQNADIANVQAQINASKIKANNLRVKLERIKAMFEKGAETQQTLDDAQAEYEQSEKEGDRLAAVLQIAQSKLNEITTDVSVATADIERRKVKAPIDGVLLNMDLTEGTAVAASAPLFDFAPNSPLTVLCEVDELWASKIKVGQHAAIRTQGMDDKLATGEVIYLSTYLKKKSLFSDDSSNMEDRRVREVRIRLNGAPTLLINARVEAVIEL